MWRVEFNKVYFGHDAPIAAQDYETYKEACEVARFFVCDGIKEAAVYKVGGCPLQHHVDGTKTTVYTWDTKKRKPYRWFW